MLLVTHYADEAERLCDRVALIQAGQLAGWPALHLAELLDPRRAAGREAEAGPA